MATDTLTRAEQILPEIISLRRKIHANPELGNQLPETTAAVIESLAGLDLDIRYSKETTGFVASLQGGKPGPRILLRADMDALPMPEDNELEFVSGNPGKMHACGHDSHTAMLVGAIKLLHEDRDSLNGCVDFFFQTRWRSAFVVLAGVSSEQTRRNLRYPPEAPTLLAFPGPRHLTLLI